MSPVVQAAMNTAVTVAVSLLVTFIFNGIINFPKKKKKEEEKRQKDITTLKQGMQSILKADLRRQYDLWIEQGFAADDVKEDLEEEYKAYHNLGLNGVMDSKRAKFMNLPSHN